MKMNLAALVCSGLFMAMGCSQGEAPAVSPSPSAQPTAPAGPGTTADATTQPSAAAGNTRTTASGLMITEVKEGAGTAAVAGDNVTVNYTGTFKDGKKFDSSYDRNQPFTFVLGAHQVIGGWDEGVAGMKPGERRKLVIPPELGYGAGGTPDGTIPANTTLYFDVELISASH